MEAVKDRFARFVGNPWTLVVDSDANLPADLGGGDLDQPAARRKGNRIVQDIVDRTRQSPRLAEHDRAGAAWPGEGDSDVAGGAPLFDRGDDLLDQRAKIDRLEARAGQFGVCPGRLGHV